MNLVPFLLGIRKADRIFWKMKFMRRDRKYMDIRRWYLGNRPFGLPTGQDGRIKTIKQKGELHRRGSWGKKGNAART